MTFWLTLHSRTAPLHSVEDEVADRITRCYAGPAWLRRRFAARSSVRVDLLTHDETSISVEHLKPHGWGGGPGGPKEVRCRLHIPASWLADPGDALLALRLFQAVLHALQAIGERYGIGTPSAVGPAADRGDPELWDPFGPPPQLPSYAETNAHLEGLAASLRPDELLLAAKQPRQCRTVREALGTVIEQHTFPEATAWTIQTRS